MEVAAIMDTLKENRDRKFPREVIKQAIVQKDEITPLLLAEITLTPEKLTEIEKNFDYFRHIYAFYLLAQFRENQAYPLMIDFISTPGEVIMDIMGDLVTGDLGSILASVCGGDLSLIKQTIENTEINEYVRSAGLSALITLVIEDELSRESVLEYFEELWPQFQQQKTEVDDFLSHSLLMDILDLCPSESLIPLLRQTYEADEVDPQWSDIDDLNRAINTGAETSIEKLRSRREYTFVTDAIASMEWWACFQGNAPKQKRVAPAGIGLASGFAESKTGEAKRKKKRQSQKQARKQNRSKKKR